MGRRVERVMLDVSWVMIRWLLYSPYTD